MVEDYRNAFDDRASVVLIDIETDDDVDLAFEEEGIDFSPYNNPDVDINSSARFAVHEIIGGTTVRQKIGENPTEISIEGVCTEEVAAQVDQLRNVKSVKVLGGRITNGIRCHVASAATEPQQSGGAADMDSGTFLYTFRINLVETEAPAGQSVRTPGGGGGGFLRA